MNPSKQALQITGSVIGIVTGVASLIALVASNASAARTVIEVAGLIGAIGFCLVCVVREWIARTQPTPVSVGALLSSGTAPELGVAVPWCVAIVVVLGLFVVGIRWPFWLAGWVMIAAVPVLIVMEIRDEAEMAKLRVKQCPECAETVQRAATKCRFCGHTFPVETEPPPFTLP
jgi:Uncharacterised protein family UPF0547